MDAVDEGGLAHIGDADDHQAHGLLHAAGGGALHGGAGGLLNAGEDLLGLAAVGVEAHGGEILAAEVFHPAGGLPIVGQVGLVQDEDAGLAAGELLQIRVAGGQRRARVAELDDGVHGAQLILQQAAGLGHVAGIPVDLRHGA